MSISAEKRKKYGIGDTGKYPVFNHKTCMSSIKLRHHGDISASRVLSHAARWARKNDDST